MSNNKSNGKEFNVLVSIRDKNFKLLEEFSCSGKSAIIDTIYHLDEKYNVSPLEFLKKFW